MSMILSKGNLSIHKDKYGLGVPSVPLVNIQGSTPVTLSAENYAMLQPSVSWSMQCWTRFSTDGDEIAWLVSYVDANNWIAIYRDNGSNRLIARVIKGGVAYNRRVQTPPEDSDFIWAVSWNTATNTLRATITALGEDAISSTNLTPGTIAHAKLFSNNGLAADDEQFDGRVTLIKFYANAWDAAQNTTAATGADMGVPTWQTTGTYLYEP